MDQSDIDNIDTLTADDHKILAAIASVSPSKPELAFVTFAKAAGKDLAVDYRHADLCGYFLRDQDLSAVNLEGADLRGADLHGAVGYRQKGTVLDNSVDSSLVERSEAVAVEAREAWHEAKEERAHAAAKFGSIFISANQQVVAQYERLESALGPCLPPEYEMDKAVRAYVWGVLSELAPPEIKLAPDGSEIDEEGARLLCEWFRDAVSLDVQKNKPVLTDGGVSFNFSCLVYYILGRPNRAPTRLQIKTLRAVCDIADTRPLPVMRWTEFVRSNVSDVARIRTIMRSCIYSKTLQSRRLTNVVASLKRSILKEKDNIRVLAIGSSGTVMDALQGLSEVSKIEVFLTRRTAGIVLDQDNLGFDVVSINEDDLPTDVNRLRFDLIVMGCGVIGKTTDNKIEIANWARDIDIATRMRKLGVLLIIVGGLYKIWPQSFYEYHKEMAINKRKETLAGFEAILSQRDIDWLITEHDAFSFREPNRPLWVEFLFAAHSLDVTTSLSLVANEKSESDEGAFIQGILQGEKIRDIDENLGLLGKNASSRYIYREHIESPRYAAIPVMAMTGLYDIFRTGVLYLQKGASTSVGADAPFREGSRMPAQQSTGFSTFKLGLLLMNVGMAFWALFLGSNQTTLAFGASIIAVVGANILMLAVLGGRRRD